MGIWTQVLFFMALMFGHRLHVELSRLTYGSNFAMQHAAYRSLISILHNNAKMSLGMSKGVF